MSGPGEIPSEQDKAEQEKIERTMRRDEREFEAESEQSGEGAQDVSGETEWGPSEPHPRQTA